MESSTTGSQNVQNTLQRLMAGLQRTIRVFKVVNECDIERGDVHKEAGKGVVHKPCQKHNKKSAVKQKYSPMRLDKRKLSSEEELKSYDYETETLKEFHVDEADISCSSSIFPPFPGGGFIFPPFTGEDRHTNAKTIQKHRTNKVERKLSDTSSIKSILKDTNSFHKQTRKKHLLPKKIRRRTISFTKHTAASSAKSKRNKTTKEDDEDISCSSAIFPPFPGGGYVFPPFSGENSMQNVELLNPKSIGTSNNKKQNLKSISSMKLRQKPLSPNKKRTPTSYYKTPKSSMSIEKDYEDISCNSSIFPPFAGGGYIFPPFPNENKNTEMLKTETSQTSTTNINCLSYLKETVLQKRPTSRKCKGKFDDCTICKHRNEKEADTGDISCSSSIIPPFPGGGYVFPPFSGEKKNIHVLKAPNAKTFKGNNSCSSLFEKIQYLPKRHKKRFSKKSKHETVPCAKKTELPNRYSVSKVSMLDKEDDGDISCSSSIFPPFAGGGYIFPPFSSDGKNIKFTKDHRNLKYSMVENDLSDTNLFKTTFKEMAPSSTKKKTKLPFFRKMKKTAQASEGEQCKVIDKDYDGDISCSSSIFPPFPGGGYIFPPFSAEDYRKTNASKKHKFKAIQPQCTNKISSTTDTNFIKCPARERAPTLKVTKRKHMFSKKACKKTKAFGNEIELYNKIGERSMYQRAAAKEDGKDITCSSSIFPPFPGGGYVFPPFSDEIKMKKCQNPYKQGQLVRQDKYKKQIQNNRPFMIEESSNKKHRLKKTISFDKQIKPVSKQGQRKAVSKKKTSFNETIQPVCHRLEKEDGSDIYCSGSIFPPFPKGYLFPPFAGMKITKKSQSKLKENRKQRSKFENQNKIHSNLFSGGNKLENKRPNKSTDYSTKRFRKEISEVNVKSRERNKQYLHRGIQQHKSKKSKGCCRGLCSQKYRKCLKWFYRERKKTPLKLTEQSRSPQEQRKKCKKSFKFQQANKTKKVPGTREHYRRPTAETGKYKEFHGQSRNKEADKIKDHCNLCNYPKGTATDLSKITKKLPKRKFKKYGLKKYFTRHNNKSRSGIETKRSKRNICGAYKHDPISLSKSKRHLIYKGTDPKRDDSKEAKTLKNKKGKKLSLFKRKRDPPTPATMLKSTNLHRKSLNHRKLRNKVEEENHHKQKCCPDKQRSESKHHSVRRNNTGPLYDQTGSGRRTPADEQLTNTTLGKTGLTYEYPKHSCDHSRETSRKAYHAKGADENVAISNRKCLGECAKLVELYKESRALKKISRKYLKLENYDTKRSNLKNDKQSEFETSERPKHSCEHNKIPKLKKEHHAKREIYNSPAYDRKCPGECAELADLFKKTLAKSKKLRKHLKLEQRVINKKISSKSEELDAESSSICKDKTIKNKRNRNDLATFSDIDTSASMTLDDFEKESYRSNFLEDCGELNASNKNDKPKRSTKPTKISNVYRENRKGEQTKNKPSGRKKERLQKDPVITEELPDSKKCNTKLEKTKKPTELDNFEPEQKRQRKFEKLENDGDFKKLTEQNRSESQSFDGEVDSKRRYLDMCIPLNQFCKTTDAEKTSKQMTRSKPFSSETKKGKKNKEPEKFNKKSSLEKWKTGGSSSLEKTKEAKVVKDKLREKEAHVGGNSSSTLSAALVAKITAEGGNEKEPTKQKKEKKKELDGKSSRKREQSKYLDDKVNLKRKRQSTDPQNLKVEKKRSKIDEKADNFYVSQRKKREKDLNHYGTEEGCLKKGSCLGTIKKLSHERERQNIIKEPRTKLRIDSGCSKRCMLLDIPDVDIYNKRNKLKNVDNVDDFDDKIHFRRVISKIVIEFEDVEVREYDKKYSATREISRVAIEFGDSLSDEKVVKEINYPEEEKKANPIELPSSSKVAEKPPEEASKQTALNMLDVENLSSSVKPNFVLIVLMNLERQLGKILDACLQCLQKQGMKIESDISPNYLDIVFIKIEIPDDVAVKMAEIYDVKLTCMNRYFEKESKTTDTRDLALINMEGIIDKKPNEPTSSERICVLYEVLRTTRFTDEPEDFGICEMKRKGILIDAYPLHDGTGEDNIDGHINDRELLRKLWASAEKVFNVQPIQRIRKYFGSEVAYYFAFVGLYITCLIPLAIGGMITVVYGSITINSNSTSTQYCKTWKTMCPVCKVPKDCGFYLFESCRNVAVTHLFDNKGAIWFIILSSFWGVVFMVIWTRKENTLKASWDTYRRVKVDQFARPAYIKRAQGWSISPLTGEREPHATKSQEIISKLVVFCGLLAAVIIVLFILLLLILYRIETSKNLANQTKTKNSEGVTVNVRHDAVLRTAFRSAMLSSVVVVIFNYVFDHYAILLTNVENPKTQTDYDRSYTLKLLFLSYINEFYMPVYLSFFRSATYTNPGDIDMWRRLYGINSDVCDTSGCLIDVVIFLSIFLIVKSLANCFHQLVRPKYFRTKKKYLELTRPQWEEDYDLARISSYHVTRLFIDKITQCALVISFMSAFPLLPLEAFIFTIIDMRVNAVGILKYRRRPVERQSCDRKFWRNILYTVTFFGVIIHAFCATFLINDVERRTFEKSKRFVNNGSYIDSTFQEFKLKFYQQFENTNENFQTCLFYGKRNPSRDDNDKKYDRNGYFFEALASKLNAFTIIVVSSTYIFSFPGLVVAIGGIIYGLVPIAPHRTRQKVNFLENQEVF